MPVKMSLADAGPHPHNWDNGKAELCHGEQQCTFEIGWGRVIWENYVLSLGQAMCCKMTQLQQASATIVGSNTMRLGEAMLCGHA